MKGQKVKVGSIWKDEKGCLYLFHFSNQISQAVRVDGAGAWTNPTHSVNEALNGLEFVANSFEEWQAGQRSEKVLEDNTITNHQDCSCDSYHLAVIGHEVGCPYERKK